MITALFKNCMKYFWKAAVISIVVFLSAGVRIHAEGGINSNEARVISVARGGFAYNNELYIAKQEYVDQLIGYLSRENINMTESQADKAINAIYSNIETGVNEGYIVKQGSPEDDIDLEEEVEISEISPEEKRKGITDISEVKEAKTTPAPGAVVYSDDGKAHGYDNEGAEVVKLDGILKNTGLSYGLAVTVLKILAGIFVFTMIVAAGCIIYERRGKNGA